MDWKLGSYQTEKKKNQDNGRTGRTFKTMLFEQQ